MGPYISLQCASCHSGFYVVLKIFVPVTYDFIEFWWLQGGVWMYVATWDLFKMKTPTVIVPVGIKPTVEKLFDVHRELDGSELEHLSPRLGCRYALLSIICSLLALCVFAIWTASLCWHSEFHLLNEHLSLQIGEELNIGRNLVVKPFQTYHVITSQVCINS
jgi:ribonuclease Z